MPGKADLLDICGVGLVGSLESILGNANRKEDIVGKSTVYRSGLTPLRAQIPSDRLVYYGIYPLASLYLSLSALIMHLDSAKIKDQLSSVPVSIPGGPAVPDTWVSAAISPVGIPELPYMCEL